MPSFLTRDKLDPAILIAEVASEGCGATAVFLGTVRATPEDGPITGIDYTAYPEMAEQEFSRIVGEAKERWKGARIALRHRLGWVPLGEASIAISVASPHRAEAYECSRYLIEETKKRAPIWKKEKLAEGAERWVESHA